MNGGRRLRCPRPGDHPDDDGTAEMTGICRSKTASASNSHPVLPAGVGLLAHAAAASQPVSCGCVRVERVQPSPTVCVRRSAFAVHAHWSWRQSECGDGSVVGGGGRQNPHPLLCLFFPCFPAVFAE
jgi:hypothetical protein